MKKGQVCGLLSVVFGLFATGCVTPTLPNLPASPGEALQAGPLTPTPTNSVTSTTVTTVTTTTTTTTTAPQPAIAGDAVAVMADGERVPIYYADDSDVGRPFAGDPAIVAMRPSDGNYKLGQQAKWVPLCKDIRRRFPAAKLAWVGDGGSHPILFRLIKDNGQKVDYWQLDCTGLSEKTVAGNVSKLHTVYAEKQKLGYDILAWRTPYTASALKAGAVGIVEPLPNSQTPTPTHSQTPTPTNPPTPPPTHSPLRRALSIGLAHVDPAAYAGWDGECPGADVDAQTFALLCREQGLDTKAYYDSQASRSAIRAAVRSALEGMTSGDLLVLFISGHGGQVKDLGGDEADGQDETMCLWDGELVDDVLASWLELVPPGVRVFFVADTCNSGTNYRARSRRSAIPRGFAGALIHFGGCADGKSSYGDEQGGRWTTALIDAWSTNVTFRAWFAAAAKKMPKSQRPVYEEFGVVSEAYRTAKALQ